MRIRPTAVALLCTLSGSAHAEEALGTNGGPELDFKGCVAYEHIDFGGHTFTIRGNYDLSYFGSRWNDKISSIACNPYCSMTVWADRDFKGASTTFYPNTAFVGDAWNDRISSAKVRCR